MKKIEDTRLEDVIFFLMERTMRKARSATKVMFKQHGFGVTLEQWILLKRIYEELETGISQVELANTTFKEPAAVTRTLDILQRKELIERLPNPDDRRAFLIQLSDEGKTLVERMTPLVQAMRKEAFAGLNDDEMNTLKKLINSIYEQIE